MNVPALLITGILELLILGMALARHERNLRLTSAAIRFEVQDRCDTLNWRLASLEKYLFDAVTGAKK